jgi:hypothetical protein
MFPRYLFALCVLPDIVADRERIALKSSLDVAPARGEFRPAPSSAPLPGCVEKPINVPTPDSTAAETSTDVRGARAHRTSKIAR